MSTPFAGTSDSVRPTSQLAVPCGAVPCRGLLAGQCENRELFPSRGLKQILGAQRGVWARQCRDGDLSFVLHPPGWAPVILPQKSSGSSVCSTILLPTTALTQDLIPSCPNDCSSPVPGPSSAWRPPAAWETFDLRRPDSVIF